MTSTYNFIINPECMRDFCGSFYNIRNRNSISMLLYLIPEATEKAVRQNPAWFGATSDSCPEIYREFLQEGFEALLFDTRTSSCVNDWLNGKRKVEDFSTLELANIIDVYYVDTVSANVELVAYKLMAGK